MEGNFLSKHFTSSGTESEIFCDAGMETDGLKMGETLGKGGSAAAGAVAVLGWSLEQQ
jgi:orotate phosphoribosyltransferase